MRLYENHESSGEMFELSKKRDELLRLYTKAKPMQKRRFLEQLIRINIEMEDYETAESYLEEYTETSPKDRNAYIYQYKIKKASGCSLDELIEILEELKKCEYIEKWGYKLSYLYYKTNQIEKCKKECKELIVWFGEGRYIDNARKLISYCEGNIWNINEDALIEDGLNEDSINEDNIIEEAIVEEYLIDNPEDETYEDNNMIDEQVELENLARTKEEKDNIISKQMDFAIEYIESKDYSLTDDGREALKGRIISDYGKTSDEISQTMNIVQIVKEAIQKSERRCMKDLIRVVQERKYMESGLLLLIESDFYDF